MSDKLKDHCGVTAVYLKQKGDVPKSLFFSLFALQHRGQESAGITFIESGNMTSYKGKGLVDSVLSPYVNKFFDSSVGIGHVRYSTSGDGGLHNVQPLQINCNKGNIALAHNGNITNADFLRNELRKEGAIFQSNSDTEVILHLISHSKKQDFYSAFLESLSKLEGAFTLVVLHEDVIYALCDPYGFRPLYIGENSDKILIASETSSMSILKVDDYSAVKPGEVVKIDGSIVVREKYIENHPVRQCIFELIYFAKPSSEVFNYPVTSTRKKMGRLLAKEDSDDLGDIVIPVPDSGINAALGYAEEKGLPFDFGFSRSHYAGRSFITPENEDRELAVRMKLLPVKNIIENKRVVLVDDSIVRGNTINILVKILKECGAKEIHIRLSAPEIKWPCYFGIDTPNKEGLVSNSFLPKDLAKKVGADSIKFISIESLRECVSNPSDFCYHCFTGVL